MTTVVKTYHSHRGFQKDALRMSSRGYTVASTYQTPSKNKPLRNLMKLPVGGTLVWGSSMKGGRVVVTYQIAPQPGYAPQGMLMPAPASRPTMRPLAHLGKLLLVTIMVLAVVAVLAAAIHPF